MSDGADRRTVLFLDTNSVHYMDLFIRFAEKTGLVGETERCALYDRISELADKNYKDSLRSGCNIVHFALQQDALLEYSPVSKIELISGRVKGAIIENAAKEGVPDRMWSRIYEKEIRDRSIEEDLKRIRTRIDDIGPVLERWGIVLVCASEGSRAMDVLELAAVIVGLVYMGRGGQYGVRKRDSGTSRLLDHWRRLPDRNGKLHP